MNKEDINDLTGQRFGKLLVVGYSHKYKGNQYYNCLCDCSEGLDSRPIVKIKGKQLKDGSTKSCGCLRKEHVKSLPKSNKQVFTKVELEELPYYKEIKAVWVTNRSHCNTESGDGHKSYIKKGIKFCDEWDNDMLGFLRFYIWATDHQYVAGKSQLDRIDKNKGFSPDNCRLIDKPRSRKAKEENKPTDVKQPDVIITQPNEVGIPVNIFNNILLTSDELKMNFAKMLLQSVGIQFKQSDEQKGTILIEAVAENKANLKKLNPTQ